MRKKYIILLVCALTVLVLFAGCSKPADNSKAAELAERFLTVLYTSDAERYGEFKQSDIYNDPAYDPEALLPDQFSMYTDLYGGMCSGGCIEALINTSHGNMYLAVDEYAEKYGYEKIYVSGITMDGSEKLDGGKSTAYDCTVKTCFEKDGKVSEKPISVRVSVSHDDNLVVSFRPKDAVLLNPI